MKQIPIPTEKDVTDWYVGLDHNPEIDHPWKRTCWLYRRLVQVDAAIAALEGPSWRTDSMDVLQILREQNDILKELCRP